MAQLSATIVNGHLRITGKLYAPTFNLDGTVIVPLTPTAKISENTTSTAYVSAKQIVEYITGLKG